MQKVVNESDHQSSRGAKPSDHLTSSFFTLNGEWQFTLGNAHTRMPVPAAWEAHIADHDTDGPAIYQREFDLPDGWLNSGEAIWLEAQAVSFTATVFINDALAGAHTGLWSPFAFNITHLLRPGHNHIHLEVWKPGQRYPLRECLAGFLPDVYKPFGGIWQTIGLRLGGGQPAAAPLPHQPKNIWRTQGDQVLLNDAPVHLRGVLDWGWHSKKLAPTRSAAEVRDMITKARALNFNLIKACLYVPDSTFFEVCSAEGMWVWLELPLWQAQATPAFKALARREVEAILQQVQRHDCIAILSLGCELDTQIDAVLLGELRQLARHYLPQVLHCDNSGSAEAYGGVSAAGGDFYDYHFYTDPHFFEALVDHFDRRYQPSKPWVYGEFCDADTLRAHPDALSQNPQSLTSDPSLAQATVVRKFILEQTRKRHASGGYVLTGWQDTPITISGVVNDNGDLKFDPATWGQFNADRVLVTDRLRARRWQYGGDRPAYLDPYVFWADEPMVFAVALSNGAAALAQGEWRWRISDPNGAVLASGAQPAPNIKAGEVAQIGVLEVDPARLIKHESIERGLNTWRLDISLHVGKKVVSNTWSFWQVPRIAPPDDFCTRLTPVLVESIEAGLEAICWLTEPDPRFTRNLPFWREAIHYFEPHELWGSVNHAGYADQRFYSIASDFAINLPALTEMLKTWATTSQVDIKPIWRRLDARQGHWHEYLIEAKIGHGRLWLSTLRFAGGLGYQPATFADNPMGSWLLKQIKKFHHKEHKDRKEKR